MIGQSLDRTWSSEASKAQYSQEAEREIQDFPRRLKDPETHGLHGLRDLFSGENRIKLNGGEESICNADSSVMVNAWVVAFLQSAHSSQEQAECLQHEADIRVNQARG